MSTYTIAILSPEAFDAMTARGAVGFQGIDALPVQVCTERVSATTGKVTRAEYVASNRFVSLARRYAGDYNKAPGMVGLLKSLKPSDIRELLYAGGTAHIAIGDSVIVCGASVDASMGALPEHRQIAAENAEQARQINERTTDMRRELVANRPLEIAA